MSSPSKFILFALLASSGELAAKPNAQIDVWQRKGAPGVAARKDVKAVDLDALPAIEIRRPDIQYGGWFSYRGVPLQTVIDRYGAPPEADLALLHFANGMQVPYAFRDAALVKQLDVFVARGLREAPGAPFTTGTFPSISRPREGFVDVRPITFGANKVVVSGRVHPAVPKEAEPTFSPWTHVDSLTGIELVSSKAYYAQFDVDASADVRAGLRIFTETCQFCHGARGVGAAFGWDFVEPVPVYSYHSTKNLFYHVKYKPLDASARGLLMPALSHLSEQDATSVWRWLRAIATHPMPSYAP